MQLCTEAVVTPVPKVPGYSAKEIVGPRFQAIAVMALALLLPVVAHLVPTRGNGTFIPSVLTLWIVLAWSFSGEHVIRPYLNGARTIRTNNCWLEAVGVGLAHNRMERDRIHALCQPKGINHICRVVVDVRVEIDSCIKSLGIFANEAARDLVKIARAVVVEPRFGVKLSRGVLEGIGECSGRSR